MDKLLPDLVRPVGAPVRSGHDALRLSTKLRQCARQDPATHAVDRAARVQRENPQIFAGSPEFDSDSRGVREF